MTLLGHQAHSQDNTTASAFYQKANQEVTAAGLPDLAKRFEPKAGNTWYAVVPLNDELEQIVGNLENAVELVRQASRMPLGNLIGENDPDPLILREIKSSSRNIITLMTLQSRDELQNGHPEQAVDDLLSCLALSNHIGQNAVSITKLVEIAVNKMATQAIARSMPDLPASALQSFLVKLGKLPVSSSAPEVFLNERAYAAKLMNQQKGIYPEKSVQGVLNCYEEWAALMKLPWADQIEQIDVLSKKYANDPIVRASLPMLSNMRIQMQLIDLNRQILEAGAQVLVKGEEALDAIKDPFDESSFDYSKTPNGFILRSQFEIRGNPVSLQFGL
jgi:hypothetical protein